MSEGTGGPSQMEPQQERSVCPRHPNVESLVRCQRCQRPTCVTCQREAVVGVQCVDCVAQGAASVRTAQTAFGGQLRQGLPVVTVGLIIACVVVYIGQIIPGTKLTDRLDFVPILAESQPYRFLTAAFTHSPTSPLHIAFNMYALWVVGPYLESLLGRLRYLALYLTSALGGSVAMLLLANSSNNYDSWFTGTVGASGAVFGLFAAVVAVNRRLRRDSSSMVAIMAINLVIGFLPGLNLNVAWGAHVGGIVIGGALAWAMGLPVPVDRRRLVHAALFAGLWIVLIGASLAKMASAPL